MTLHKHAAKEAWTDIKPKKQLINEKTKKKAGKDEENPYGDLMGMMKDMYENGDDTTKRMISESW